MQWNKNCRLSICTFRVVVGSRVAVRFCLHKNYLWIPVNFNTCDIITKYVSKIIKLVNEKIRARSPPFHKCPNESSNCCLRFIGRKFSANNCKLPDISARKVPNILKRNNIHWYKLQTTIDFSGKPCNAYGCLWKYCKTKR